MFWVVLAVFNEQARIGAASLPFSARFLAKNYVDTLLCALSVSFLHWNCNFYTAGKSMFCSAKIALLWLFSAASWSSVFFTLELQSEAVQNRTDVLGTGGKMGRARRF